jgi:uncharacterized membrane protein
MKEMITEIFANNANIILFFHVLGAFIWVGGMIAIRFAVHPAMQHIDDAKIKLARTLEIMKNFFSIVMVFIVVIVITGVMMSIGMDFKSGDQTLYMLTHVKEGIWLIMTINFTLMYMRRNKAEKLFIAGDLAGTKTQLAPLAAYMIPINIVLGLIALALGGILRGF